MNGKKSLDCAIFAYKQSSENGATINSRVVAFLSNVTWNGTLRTKYEVYRGFLMHADLNSQRVQSYNCCSLNQTKWRVHYDLQLWWQGFDQHCQNAKPQHFPFFFQAGRRASEKVVDGFVGEQRAKADSHDDCLTTFYRRCWAFTWQAIGFNACCCGWPAWVNVIWADSYCSVYCNVTCRACR